MNMVTWLTGGTQTLGQGKLFTLNNGYCDFLLAGT